MQSKCPIRLFINISLWSFFNLMFFSSYAQPDLVNLNNELFTLQCSSGGLTGIQNTLDSFHTNFVHKGKKWAEVEAKFEWNGKIDSIFSTEGATIFSNKGKLKAEFAALNQTTSIALNQSFNLEDSFLFWRIQLINKSGYQVNIEDLSIPFFYNNEGSEIPTEIFEQRVIEHKYISGNNSFIFWEKPSGEGPYLIMVPAEGGSLEYFNTASFGKQENVSQVFIHSKYTVEKDNLHWRQPISGVVMRPGEIKSYSFKFRWAKDYNDIRRILFQEGLLDVHVAPGVTIPTDLKVNLAFVTRQKIKSIQAEFPRETDIHITGLKDRHTYIYEISFSRLGENKLTVHYNDNYQTSLEFFVTEPLETLYKKRASFIVHHQQHKDSTKWYDGLFSVWDMKNSVLRGPDNDDGFNSSRLTYLLTCDDPILCKAPFVAAKNVFFPNQEEIDAIEYHIIHYVWGGLQRTDKETNPYGVYGTPNWLSGRDSLKRAARLDDPNRNKMHMWRSYDYPHIMMMYYHMYQIACLYPGMVHYLDSTGYLIRAKETAKAYFRYPYEILPWYETYKWGCYNELLIPDLIEILKKKNYPDDAYWLKREWEKKVKYFIYDDTYPFRSEYAVDATAYESTEAFARYALINPMQPDSMLWFDKNLHRWYSHPNITDSASRRFLLSQIQANMASRGTLETSYYYLGSDFRGSSDHYLLSYMAQMGGWSLLDYGLNFASNPAEYIQLGYASYLSSFALMNTGTVKSNYGFWYPGKQNDGAAGWAFEPQLKSRNWIGKKQYRGPWYYDGEIDLGFGGATRTAATVIVCDSIFGWMSYGGNLRKQGNVFSVIPNDGLRKRLFYRAGDKKIDLELSRDGFAKNQAVIINPDSSIYNLKIENRTVNAHLTYIDVKGLEGKYYQISDGKQAVTIEGNFKQTIFPVLLNKGYNSITTVRIIKVITN